ncbi:MAG: hypothetical protein KBA46_08420 [Candidatus Omnitrophica bacterium]|nr:hypothetical protein [Candidatus Omnitrophota bacterium]
MIPKNIERLIALVFAKWSSARETPAQQGHPDEETLACFIEQRLPAQETDAIKLHIAMCERCSESVAVALEAPGVSIKHVPEGALAAAKGLVEQGPKGASALEVCLRLNDRIWEIVSASGDILVDQELVPAPLLRSRNLNTFKDEVTLLKEFDDIRVQIRIERAHQGYFSTSVLVQDKALKHVTKEMRITLLREEVELESYVTDTGKVQFENISLGTYTIAIADLEKNLARVLIEIKR